KRFDISIGIVLKNDNAVPDVIFYRINVAILGIHVDTTVELNIRLRTSDHSFRFGPRRIRRRIVEAIEHSNTPGIGILKVDFIQSRINGDGAVNWIRIEDVADG